MGLPREFKPTKLAMTPRDLAGLLAMPLLPMDGILSVSAGEWRLAADDLWHFWQDPDSIDEVTPMIPVFKENP
jgi:hypothetical protein